MKKVINCLKEDNPVIQKKLRRVTVEEGEKIATELFEILNKRKDGIGLAANQVGIDAAVAVVNVREPIVLINPEIVSRETEIPYYEGCLSYPGKGVNTRRYETIEVKSDNVDVPFSKFKPLTKDISKSFISNDLLYGGIIFRFSNA